MRLTVCCIKNLVFSNNFLPKYSFTFIFFFFVLFLMRLFDFYTFWWPAFQQEIYRCPNNRTSYVIGVHIQAGQCNPDLMGTKAEWGACKRLFNMQKTQEPSSKGCSFSHVKVEFVLAWACDHVKQGRMIPFKYGIITSEQILKESFQKELLFFCLPFF